MCSSQQALQAYFLPTRVLGSSTMVSQDGQTKVNVSDWCDVSLSVLGTDIVNVF